MPPIPVYTLNLDDDLAYDAPEFVEGIATVLADVPENPFASKRLCLIAKENGYSMMGKDYVKTVELGIEVSRTPLTTEKEWRAALKDGFGILL